MLLTKLEKRRVIDVACKTVITVGPTDKLESVADLLSCHKIGSAPVVDGLGKCIGIITKSDLVRYDSLRESLNRQFSHGVAYDLVKNGDINCFEMLGRPFDEVAYHMSERIHSIPADASIIEASEAMTKFQFHHLLVLDEASRPVGILSSLDIVGALMTDVQCQSKN